MPNPKAHHFGLTVENIDEVMNFYSEILGFEVLSRFSVSGENFSKGVDVEEAVGDFVHLDGNGVRIELVEYSPKGKECNCRKVNQPGVKHLGFEVDDIESFYKDLPENIEKLNPPLKTESGTKIMFLRDPENNLVEILE